MEYDDMKHKMNQTHWEFLRRMLGVNEVPEPVMVRYFLIKKYLDKISAPLSVMSLLDIAIDCGFSLETGLFDGKKHVCSVAKATIEPIDIDLADNTHTVVGEAFKGEIPDTKGSPVLDLDDAAATGGTVEEVNDDPPKEEVVGLEGAPRTKTGSIKEGTKVRVFLDENLVEGVVKRHVVSASDLKMAYMVEIDGVEVEVKEKDIEELG